MEIKITKRQKLLSVRNEWVAGDWYLVHGRVISDDRKYFYRFKFVLHIDLACDLWDGENDIPYDEALNDMIWSFCDMAGDDFSNGKRIREFIRVCNDTIIRWNNRFKAA